MTIRFFINSRLGTREGVSIQPSGWDTPSTRCFSDSIVDSVCRQFTACLVAIEQKRNNNTSRSGTSRTSPLDLQRCRYYGAAIPIINLLSTKKSIEDFRFGDGKTCIKVEVYHKCKNGRHLNFCKIGIEESEENVPVRIANILPDFARLVYAVASLLSTLTPPRGMEELRNINLIKDFVHPRDKVEKVIVKKREDGLPLEAIIVPR